MEELTRLIREGETQCREGETRCRRIVVETCATADRVADTLESQGRQLARASGTLSDTNATLVQSHKTAHRMSHWWITRALFKRWRDPAAINKSHAVPKAPQKAQAPQVVQAVHQAQESDDPFADEMLSSVQRLRHLATGIGDELDRHNEMLSDMTHKADTALVRTASTTRKIDKMLH